MSFFRNVWGWMSGTDQRAFIEGLHQMRAELFALSIDEARQQATHHLSDPTKFRCILVSGNSEPPSGVRLPPLITEVFSRYEEIRECYGDVHISHDQIGQSQINPQYTRIGSNTDHTEIVILGSADKVYEKDWSDTESNGSLSHYPTLYHFILFRVRLLDSGRDTSRR
jgi:hypothetical protein